LFDAGTLDFSPGGWYIPHIISTGK
jgi:hypothetical protein